MANSSFQWIGKSYDGETVTLKRFKGFSEANSTTKSESDREFLRKGLVVDVETTGLNRAYDQVIEIGIREFEYDKRTGEVLFVNPTPISEFQDPGIELSDETTRLTGITTEMVKGKQINWRQVAKYLAGANLVIAHNAAFDRPFIEKAMSYYFESESYNLNSEDKENFHSAVKNKVWACSLKQINWNSKGYPNAKLEILSIYHGFYTDAHRALCDSDALLHLMTFHDIQTHRPYFHELLTNVRRPVIDISANFAPFEAKDALKSRGYYWDPAKKSWHKTIHKDSLQDEVAWMESYIYNGAFRGTVREIAPTEQFKLPPGNH